jgi:hypothetical protein
VAEAVGETAGGTREDGREGRSGQGRGTGLQHGVAPDAGEEEDVAEDQREEGGGEEQGAEVAEAEGAVGEEGRLDDWTRVAGGAPDHAAQQERRGGEGAQGGDTGPAPVVALDDRQRHQRQAGGQHQCPGQVGQAGVEPGSLAQGAAAEGYDGGAERQVDEEDQAPVGEHDQGAAQSRADRRRRGRSGAPDADPGRPLLEREGIEDERQRGRRDHRRADALDHAEGDQEAERGRQCAEQAGGGETRDPEQEDPLVAKAVGEPAGGHEQGGDDDEVAVEHPGERVASRPGEGARDVGEGDVDDRRVEEGEEGAGACDRHGASMSTVIHRGGTIDYDRGHI